MKAEELAIICNYLPWDPKELPTDVEFYCDFVDPAKQSTFSSKIEDGVSPFFKSFDEEIFRRIKFHASIGLRVKGSDQSAHLLTIGLDGKEFSDEELKALEWPNPCRAIAIGSVIFLLFNHESNDSATKFLNKWIDDLGDQSSKKN